MFDLLEIGVFADAVSLPGPEVVSDAEEPPAEISARDEDERIPLQHAWYREQASLLSDLAAATFPHFHLVCDLLYTGFVDVETPTLFKRTPGVWRSFDSMSKLHLLKSVTHNKTDFRYKFQLQVKISCRFVRWAAFGLKHKTHHSVILFYRELMSLWFPPESPVAFTPSPRVHSSLNNF